MPGAIKSLRLGRFCIPDRDVGVIVPIDHGLTMGALPGIQSLDQIAGWIRNSGITGVIAHKGMLERLLAQRLLNGLGVMLHLNGVNASASNPNAKVLVTEVETAIRLGADAVSVQLNFDGSTDANNLRLLGQVVDRAMPYNLPVLAMIYDATERSQKAADFERMAHLIRIAIELGADAVKIAAPEKISDVARLLGTVAKDIRVFFAGGELCDDDWIRALMRESMRSGGAGLCLGRNVFQRSSSQGLLSSLRSELDAHARSSLARESIESNALIGNGRSMVAQ